jgi:hypothetical protein
MCLTCRSVTSVCAGLGSISAFGLFVAGVLVSQLLADGIILIVSQDGLSPQALLHVAQLSVAAFQVRKMSH